MSSDAILQLKQSVLPSANPIGEISSGYPTNVYDGNRLLFPILRQEMAQVLWYDVY